MNIKETINIKVEGLVQGVGFRPFIYRIAIKNNIKGRVDNRNDGVYICASGLQSDLKKFTLDIKNEAPSASIIHKIDVVENEFINFKKFEIVKSKNTSEGITDVSPDIAVCDECLVDLREQDFRINYPFINCTNCGPRFSIIKDLPYDREKTTMVDFEMCNKCKNEYINVLDRRFHAQPIACNSCGPVYTLYSKNQIYNQFDDIIDICSSLIDKGEIVAIKGIGGFFISCDATNEKALHLLRGKKHREKKPFAVMFKNIDAIEAYCQINVEEKEIISSWQRPIVLLKSKFQFSTLLNNGLKTIGAMLPYMPIHYLLFEKLNTDVIVLTSGNISDEPIIIDNDKALKKLSIITDNILTYNRDIYNRIDDSVVSIFDNKRYFFRRSRAYVPTTIKLDFNVDGIIATGAELSNCFCIGKDKQAIMSQHIGDLKNIETLEFYEESMARFKKLFRLNPKVIVSDLHPNYLSTKYANNSNLKHIQVQHHHAHIVSCMVDNNINEKVIGVSFDGVGLGTDGNIWGGEFLVCDYNDFERYTHFEYIAIPGGDKAGKENWRTALAYLYNVFGKELLKIDIPLIKNNDTLPIEMLISAIEKKINSPLYSSAGRLFDAVSALINLCTKSTYQAEAPMLLESIIEDNVYSGYNYEIKEQISFKQTIREILDDIKNNIPISVISAKFHNTLSEVVIDVAIEIRKSKNINIVALSGGVFQNKYLFEKSLVGLRKNNFQVLTHYNVPSNDGGIALGQLVIAAMKCYK